MPQIYFTELYYIDTVNWQKCQLQNFEHFVEGDTALELHFPIQQKAILL